MGTRSAFGEGSHTRAHTPKQGPSLLRSQCGFVLPAKSLLFHRAFIYIHFPVLCEPPTISREKKSGETAAINFIPNRFSSRFSTCRTNGLRLLSQPKTGTHSALGEGSHTRAHTPKQGCFGWGWYHYPRSVSHGSETLRGRDLKRQTLPLLGFGRVYSRRTQKAFGTAMRSCVSLSQGVAAPLGCVIFFPLSKLRLLRPIPETSFGFPDAPACAVPVQAASRLVPQRTLSAFQTESYPSDYTEVIN